MEVTAGYRIPIFSSHREWSAYNGNPKVPSGPAQPSPAKHPKAKALWRLQCAVEELALAGEIEIRHDVLMRHALDAGVDPITATQIFWDGPDIAGLHTGIFSLIEQAEKYQPLDGDQEIEDDAA